MLRFLVFACLTLSVGANAAIVSFDSTFGTDTITRDTSTGLSWLDVNLTHGLTYNQVNGQLGPGGDYEGFRYATAREFDQLIVNFGYTPLRHGCADGFSNCDLFDLTAQRDPAAKILIDTLGGGTGDAFFAGGIGILGITISDYADSSDARPGISAMSESFVVTSDGASLYQEWEYTAGRLGSLDGLSDFSNADLGSFLVASSSVPIPATAWLFVSAFLGLGVVKHKKLYF